MKKLVSFILLSGSLWLSIPALADVAVIVHPSNNDSIEGITKIFLGKVKEFESGEKAVPIYLQTGEATRDEFDSKVLGKNSAQLKAYWSKLMFTGKGSPPEELSSDAEVIARVSSDPAAIGYIDSKNVTDAVKVVSTFN